MRCSSQWLDWMVDRIQIREAELLELQKRTAEVLAETAEEERPPSPPKEENMHDPASMELYMQAMAAYSTRQRERLTCSADNSAAIAENREATAAIALLVARREELERYRKRVEELTEEDATQTPSSRDDERHQPPAEPREDP